MYQELKHFMEQNNIPQRAVCKSIDVGTATMSLYLAGKYTGDMTKLNRKVAAYLKQQQERLEMTKLNMPFVATPTAKQMLSGLALAHRMGKIGVIYGGAGTGKTTTIKEYQRRNPNCILIEPDTGFTAKILLQEICRQLGLETQGNVHDLTDRIVGALRDSGRMLMVDEAEWLPIRALESLRRIYDKSGCAVALVGTFKLLTNLKGPKQEFKQLYSRVFTHTPLGENISEDDLRCIAQTILGIEDESVLKKLVATAKGNVRKLGNLMELIQYLVGVNQTTMEAIDEAFVEQADGFLMH